MNTTMRIVGEDLDTFLITWSDTASGAEKAPQWIEKAHVPPSIYTQWDDYKKAFVDHATAWVGANTGAKGSAADFYTIYRIENTLVIVLETWMATTSSVLMQIVHQKYPEVVAHHLPIHSARTTSSELFQADSDVEIKHADADFSIDEDYTLLCNDTSFAEHVNDHSDSFLCWGAHHSTDFINSCSGCSEAAVALLTSLQQDALDSGAFFSLCDHCGKSQIDDEDLYLLYQCLEEKTKCTRCIWGTLDGLVAAKYAHLKHKDSNQCADCMTILHGDEIVSKCALCLRFRVRM